ncbi:protein of unknown function [Micropruina glycogenica]|uniref:Uncharacterized protein n=1 Tax=Micropruina glycogenica TaxID=75385 RepID=A0A2N9JLG8_9ACTN|nr:protein of unknown function [Micropruina glycogenica]
MRGRFSNRRRTVPSPFGEPSLYRWRTVPLPLENRPFTAGEPSLYRWRTVPLPLENRPLLRW